LSSNRLKGLELVYLRDPFEVYIAQIQGSARINLPSGKQLCMGYAGKTEHPYESIGLHLVSEGKIKSADLSLTTLKQYFRDHPEELAPTLNVNPCFVFFLEREPGPFGSLGAKVTPYHSLATDKSVFPRGGPCVLECRLPVGTQGDERVGFRNATVMAFDQDTGGAIRSAGRADLFIGTGDQAERLAGMTREVGKLYYFFARDPRSPQ
jgi:membrane-bound lytic murein transglycosylase A